MKKAIIYWLSAAIFLVIFMQNVSAYHDYYGTEYGLDFRDGFYTRDYRYVDYYGYPVYRVYSNRYFDNKDFREYVNKRRAVAWVLNSYDERYNLISGRKSGDVFCQGCAITSSTGFGNRRAYDYRFDGRGSYRSGNYYEPLKDVNGAFDWGY